MSEPRSPASRQELSVAAEFPTPTQKTGWPRNWPLLWIVLTPIVTVPLTQFAAAAIIGSCTLQEGFIGATWSCPTGPVLLALSPGLLNLVPVFRLFSRDPTTRGAAVAATILGGLRLLVPVVNVLATATDGQSVMSSSAFSNEFPTSDTYVICY